MRLIDHQRNVIRGATRRHPCLTPASALMAAHAAVPLLADAAATMARRIAPPEQG
jgi:hypothetical protein